MLFSDVYLFLLLRDQIRQIVKLLASIHSLENAVSVANDYNVKDVKAPSDGK